MPKQAATEARFSRSQRINLRTSGRQEAILRRAAAATDRTMTDFILDSAVERAERVLADRRRFTATDEQWDEFQRLLDAPLASTKRFEALTARKSPFSSTQQ
ncbi:MAG: type II toxin-antitoxin system TacA family antitoxin [Dermatophilaceae bacterium]